ncbi:MAG: MFS transporter [Verrucomicrobiales bacterium]|nr:MFS transporter [Verrucomicrobiales bacterium]
MSNSTSLLTSRLSLMMFLQFFLWGSWFATLGQCLGSNDFAGIIGGAYGTSPLGAIFAPLFLGLIADRFFPSEKVMGVLFLLGSLFLFLIPGAASRGDGDLMVNLMLGNMLCYMPTLALGNTIAFTHLDSMTFPKIRVWGTIGWIVAGLVVGFMGWSANMNIFYIAAATSLILGVYSFSLPNTPAPMKGEPIEWRGLLMVDAFSLFKRRGFAVFMGCSCLVCIPLAYYYGYTSTYLSNVGFTQAASTMTIGQMSEIFFMLLIPFFFRKLGVKWMILIGMLAWVLRYLLFAYGADEQVIWMILFGIALHGICYDFFFVTGFMYTDKVAPKSVRSQAQSMLVFFTQGIGLYFGYKVAGAKFINVNEDYGALNTLITENNKQENLSAGEQLVQMFSVNDLDGIDSEVVGSAMSKWEEFWVYPAVMAGIISVVFFFAFWDKISIGSDEESSSE